MSISEYDVFNIVIFNGSCGKINNIFQGHTHKRLGNTVKIDDKKSNFQIYYETRDFVNPKILSNKQRQQNKFSLSNSLSFSDSVRRLYQMIFL